MAEKIILEFKDKDFILQNTSSDISQDVIQTHIPNDVESQILSTLSLM